VQLRVSTIGGDLSIFYNPALTSLTAGRGGAFLVNGDLIIKQSPISTLQLGGVSSGAYIRGDALLTDLQVTPGNDEDGVCD
jgi:hypothetical protein